MIIQLPGKHINFYGDPLRDFCLTQFLERFSFRNPKKLDEKKAGAASLVVAAHHKNYHAHGGRGVSVQNLTKSNCTEDERFILQYLEQKREKRAAFKRASGRDDDDESVGSIDDDEFDAYLDSMGGKKVDEDDDLDFMGELGDELRDDDDDKDKKKGKKVRMVKDNDEDDDEGDWDLAGSDAEDGVNDEDEDEKR